MTNLPNLLIVDDSVDNLDLLDAIIRKKKIKANVIRALSGHMAIEKIHGIDLALAILDVEMPGMNGYELALKINQSRLNQNVPIIFLTARYLSETDISRGYDNGAVDYILKPSTIVFWSAKSMSFSTCSTISRKLSGMRPCLNNHCWSWPSPIRH